MAQKIGPVQQSDPPVVLADHIRKISDSMTKLVKSGLNRRAVIALVYDDCKVSKRDIVIIFDSLAQLEARYCK